MEKSEMRIDLALQENSCTMINPWHTYEVDDLGIVKQKIERNPENITKLEQRISQRMKILSQENLLETLEKEVPILHIDCGEKGDDDIMFFIFRECVKRSTIADKANFVARIIWKRTLLTDSPEDRKRYVQKEQPHVQEIFNQYNWLLKERKEGKDSEFIQELLRRESDITFDGLSEFMEGENTRYLYLYLDNIQHLSIDEQRRINRFLYTRWAIWNGNEWIRLKINNGSKQRKTRTSDAGLKIESTHDYSDTDIYEKDL